MYKSFKIEAPGTHKNPKTGKPYGLTEKIDDTLNEFAKGKEILETAIDAHLDSKFPSAVVVVRYEEKKQKKKGG